MSTLFVNLAGIALIAFIVWWFWLSESKVKSRSHHGVDTDID